jgi:hypothetical protein
MPCWGYIKCLSSPRRHKDTEQLTDNLLFFASPCLCGEEKKIQSIVDINYLELTFKN